jgi:hypothetical protein
MRSRSTATRLSRSRPNVRRSHLLSCVSLRRHPLEEPLEAVRPFELGPPTTSDVLGCDVDVFGAQLAKQRRAALHSLSVARSPLIRPKQPQEVEILPDGASGPGIVAMPGCQPPVQMRDAVPECLVVHLLSASRPVYGGSDCGHLHQMDLANLHLQVVDLAHAPRRNKERRAAVVLRGADPHMTGRERGHRPRTLTGLEDRDLVAQRTSHRAVLAEPAPATPMNATRWRAVTSPPRGQKSIPDCQPSARIPNDGYGRGNGVAKCPRTCRHIDVGHRPEVPVVGGEFPRASARECPVVSAARDEGDHDIGGVAVEVLPSAVVDRGGARVCVAGRELHVA